MAQWMADTSVYVCRLTCRSRASSTESQWSWRTTPSWLPPKRISISTEMQCHLDMAGSNASEEQMGWSSKQSGRCRHAVRNSYQQDLKKMDNCKDGTIAKLCPIVARRQSEAVQDRFHEKTN